MVGEVISKTIDKNGYVYLSLGVQGGKSPWLVGGRRAFFERVGRL
jgi:hypothetical protein